MGLFEKKVRKIAKEIEKKQKNEELEKIVNRLSQKLENLLSAKLPEKKTTKRYSLFGKKDYDFI